MAHTLDTDPELTRPGTRIRATLTGTVIDAWHTRGEVTLLIKRDTGDTVAITPAWGDHVHAAEEHR